jgi:hypothetical protein
VILVTLTLPGTFRLLNSLVYADGNNDDRFTSLLGARQSTPRWPVETLPIGVRLHDHDRTERESGARR